MNEILTIIRQRFVRGLREACYEFPVPVTVVGRGLLLGLRVIGKQLDTAMAEAREKASRSSAHRK